MKKKWKAWQKVLVCIVGVLVLLFITAAAVYKFVISPRYIEPAAQKLQQVLQNDENKQKIADIVVELEETGKLDDDSVIEYLEKFNVENPREALQRLKQFASSQRVQDREQDVYGILNSDNGAVENDGGTYEEQSQSADEGENTYSGNEVSENNQNNSSDDWSDSLDEMPDDKTSGSSNMSNTNSAADKILKAASSEELETATKVLAKYGQDIASFSSMGVDGMIDFMRENFTADEKAAVMAGVIKYIDLLN